MMLNCFHPCVSASDEAFVWQIMNYYTGQWAKLSISGESVQSGHDGCRVKRKGGASKGFKDTAGKTSGEFRKKYERVVMMRKEHREVVKLWSKHLRKMVRNKEHERRNEENKKAEKRVADNLASLAEAEKAFDEASKEKRPVLFDELESMEYEDYSDDEAEDAVVVRDATVLAAAVTLTAV